MKFPEKYTDSRYIVSADRRKTIVLKDARESRKYIGNNVHASFVSVYRIDGGVCSDQAPGEVKCDYGIYTGTDSLYLVELKGGDYSQALDQLQRSIQFLMQPGIEKPNVIHTRVVLSKVKIPNFLSTKEKKLMSLLSKNYHGTHKKNTQVLKEDLE